MNNTIQTLKTDLIIYCDLWSNLDNSSSVIDVVRTFRKYWYIIKCEKSIDYNLFDDLKTEWKSLKTQMLFPDEYDKKVINDFIYSVKKLSKSL